MPFPGLERVRPSPKPTRNPEESKVERRILLDPKVWWPLFPLLLLIVVVCLTWATVYVVRKSKESPTIWFQGGALACYLLAAVAAIGSEQGLISSNAHRPFSLLTQLAIVLVLFRTWKTKDRTLLLLNAVAWGAILADTALHFLMAPRPH